MGFYYILKATEALVGFLAGESLHGIDTVKALDIEWITDWWDQ